MAHFVLKINKDRILQMRQYYRNHLVTPAPAHTSFQAKLPGCTVTAYLSGKVLFQGKQAETESSRWEGVPSQPKEKKARKTTPYSPPEQIASLSVVGSDEVGTGDYFGPITVVAAYVSKSQLQLVKELGVKDSKNLKDPQIITIAKDLIKTIPYSLLVLKNEKYNDLQQKGMSQGKMKAILHNQAIGNVLEKLAGETPDAILIDQFAEPDVYFKHLSGKKIMKENVYFSTKAEGIHLSVAAASIIARYSFLMEMKKLEKKSGFTIPKGAGALVDQAAARLIEQKGVNALASFTKLHFANTNKAKLLAEKKGRG
ncbi:MULTISPECIES: ribonuclease HIII [Bacillus]|uniref:Ribonuclease HIII n=2 Tax=Bacillus TaxID=1386 RepID=A0A0M5JLP3_9BACI|nr:MULTISPECIES: ribonuclease HIII [Bacillus]ALC81964.1 ribonuclease HIII [Bacillus gobiensis]MBP1083296.1 ribonuclease HIII [Bacillus capparidis]MED1097732.1 ribonuclease HIII [Bacillus capparidis]